MPKNEEFIEIEEQYGAHNYHPLPVVLNRGERIWVWDVEGNKYLDCLSAYSALNQGHCHPRIVEAMCAQARKLALTSRAFRNDTFGPFLKKITGLIGFSRALPMNSGAEAVETAIKAVRKWGYKKKRVPEDKAEIIVCENNFHGRTTTIVGFSTEEQYKDGFGPFTPGFVVVPYGDVEAFRKAVTSNTVAFLVEPIQGEGGVLVPPTGYLAETAAICKENNVLFISDEIQTGLGRTGKLLACQHDGVKPDGVILGKALSGGMYPISAFLANDEVMGVFHPGDHGSTFGGNPLASVIASAALDVIIEERLCEKAQELGEYFMNRLRKMNSPHVDHVRGRGLLIGVVIKESSGDARPFCEKLMEEGILAKETHHTVIRFAPPLVITKEEIDAAMEKIARVLEGKL
ncbi:MAG TPA: ornithine--oxo-acid transaminase [Thermoanaerobaculia bacterium]|nr:ornithine--oxo-acid transaminase [Thermoanaerobaculia bacterium]HUM29943.1 ornithine--oxo-acid transaminase [Thermoanaerobaculia bacterium]HXK68190.1 ornithine--oxo-acid transaminase [Thermoanaerobaculia bacterium]